MDGSLFQSAPLARFLPRQLLGSGASKEVYRAFDVVLHREVAICTYLHGNDSPEAKQAILNEAQHTARVSTHSAIVTIFDVIDRRGSLCLITEYLEGGTLRDLMKDGALEPELVSSTVQRVGAALSYAHEHGLIHRDVKPENVLFTNGEAFLTDFGIATGIEEDDGTVVGTAAYIAPEQIQGKTCPASDFYSLGVMLYEMLTGRLPFNDKGTSALLTAHLKTTPTAPRVINPDIPRILNDLCVDLLDKDPTRRPRLLGERLDDLTDHADTVRTSAVFSLQSSRASGPVARSLETDAISALLQAPPGTILFRGDPGIGKSHLLKLAEVLAVDSGFSVWRGQSVERSTIPLKVILDTVLANRDSLIAAIPSIAAELERIVSRPSDDDFEFALYGLARGLLEFSRSQPLALVLDDLQWSDPATLRFLDHLMSLIESAPNHNLIVLAATRPFSDSSTLSRHLANWQRHTTFALQDLNLFSASETQQLLQKTVGETVSDHLNDFVFQATQGNPLFAIEYLRKLASDGLIHKQAGVLDTHGRPSKVNMPSMLMTLIASMTNRLNADARHLVNVAACVGGKFDVGLLTKVVGSNTEVLDGLAEIEVMGLIEGNARNYDFRHPLFRRCIYDMMPNAERASIHSQIANVLMHAANDDRYSMMQTAEHAALTLDYRSTEVPASLIVDAARAAMKMLGWDQVLRLTGALLDVDGASQQLPPRDVAEMHLLYGHSCHQLGDLESAKNHLQIALGLAGKFDSPELLGTILTRYNRLVTNHDLLEGDEQSGVQEIQDLIESEAVEDASILTKLIGTMSNAKLDAGAFDEAFEWAKSAMSTARASGRADLVAHSGVELGIAHWLQGDPASSLTVLMECLDAARSCGSRAEEARCLQRIPYVLLMLGRFREAMSYFDHARDVVDPIYETGEFIIPLTCALTISLLRGDLEKSSSLSAEGLRLHETSGYVGIEEALMTGYAQYLVVSDRATDAIRMLEQFVAHGKSHLRGFIGRHVRLIRSIAGSRKTVALEFVTYEERHDRKQASMQLRHAIPACLSVETAWQVGHWDSSGTARVAMKTLLDQGIKVVPGWGFYVPRLLGCAALMSGDIHESIALLDTALQETEANELHAESGRVNLCLARCLELGSGSDAIPLSNWHREQATNAFRRSNMTAYQLAWEQWIEPSLTQV